MREEPFRSTCSVPVRAVLAVLAILLGVVTTAQAQTVTITCGGAPVASYRWTLEEDNT